MMEKKPKCNECPWLGYIDSETSFDAFDVCVAAKKRFSKIQCPKTHPRWCPLLPGNKKKAGKEKGE